MDDREATDVEVKKYLKEREGWAAVLLRSSNSSDRAVTVTVEDVLPQALPLDSIRFMPYDPGQWTLHANEVEWRCRIEPNASEMGEYYVQKKAVETLEPLRNEPVLSHATRAERRLEGTQVVDGPARSKEFFDAGVPSGRGTEPSGPASVTEGVTLVGSDRGAIDTYVDRSGDEMKSNTGSAGGVVDPDEGPSAGDSPADPRYDITVVLSDPDVDGVVPASLSEFVQIYETDPSPETLANGEYGAEFSMTIGTPVRPEMLRDALENTWAVDTVSLEPTDDETPTETLNGAFEDALETTAPELVEPADGERSPCKTGTSSNGSDAPFEEYQQSVQPVEFQKLVGDPDYISLLDSFDMLAGPEDDISFEELLAPTANGDTSPFDGTQDTDRPDRVAPQLLSELRNDDVSEDVRAALRRELGCISPSRVTVRMRRLESRMEEFSAYTDALGEFLDGRGTARQLLDTLDDDVGDLQQNVRKLRADVDDVVIRQRDSRERIDRVERELRSLESIRAELDELEETLQKVRARDRREIDQIAQEVDRTRESLEEEIDRLGTELTILRDDVDEHERALTRIGTAFRG